MKAPYTYDDMNILSASLNPSGIKVTNTETATFFRRYLFHRATSVFKWGLPGLNPVNYFVRSLFGGGSVAMVNTKPWGVIAQHGTPGGYNVFYNPRYYHIANPLIKGFNRPVIDQQCVVFHFPDWRGILDLVYFYGDYMAITAQAAGVNIFNSKLAYVFGADNQASAESFKKAADKVNSGEPMVVVDKVLFNNENEMATPFFTQNIGQNFIAPQLFETLRTIITLFDSEVGIPTMNYNKKERTNTEEVHQNDIETSCLASMWLRDWKETAKKSYEMFGEDGKITVDWAFDINTEGGYADDLPNSEHL